MPKKHSEPILIEDHTIQTTEQEEPNKKKRIVTLDSSCNHCTHPTCPRNKEQHE